jgi:hypothetical protein
MRLSSLLPLLVLTAACTATAGQPRATDTGVNDLSSSASPSAEAALPEPLQESQEPQQQASIEAASLVPPEMGVPLVVWDSGDLRYELQLVDPATGYAFPERPAIAFGGAADYAPSIALSPDGGLLAVISGVGKACESSTGGLLSCWPSADTLRLIDLRTWREVKAELAARFPPANPPFKGWASNLVFSQDARRLALAYHDHTFTTLALFDAQTGTLIAKQPLDVRPRLMGFSADGSTLAVYGSPVAETPGMTQPDPPSALLLDAATLEVQWRTQLPAILDGTWCRESCAELNEDTRMVYWSPAVMFDPLRNRLHILHADEDRLTTIDLQARRASTLKISAAQTWFERLLALTADVAEAKYWPEGGWRSGVLSRDGTRVFSVGRTMNLVTDANGEWSANETSLGLTVIEADTGRELATRESSASRIRSSLDHHYLILDWGLTGSIEVWDAANLEMVTDFEDWDLSVGRRIDGREVFLLAASAGDRTTSPTKMAMLTPTTFEVLADWTVEGLAFWIALP